MYESSFNFSGKPFQLTPDPDFFFGSKGHTRAQAFLEYGLLQKEGFIVITGEVGAGKTTLIRALLRKLEQAHVVPAQIVTTQVDADNLLRLVAQSFGLDAPANDKAATLVQLETLFRRLHAQGRRALLVVDEAQNLTARAVEELRMLSNFQVGTDALLQSFLVGQPEFRLIMKQPEMQQLMQRVIASYHLGPLDRVETRQYIEHRLRHVGWCGTPAIEDEAFDKVHDFAGGIPRRINTTCDRLLLDCYLAERQTIAAADIDAVAAEICDEFGSPQGEAAETHDASLDNSLSTPTTLSEEQSALPSRFDVLERRLRKVETLVNGQQLATNLVLKLLDASVTTDDDSR